MEGWLIIQFIESTKAIKRSTNSRSALPALNTVGQITFKVGNMKLSPKLRTKLKYYNHCVYFLFSWGKRSLQTRLKQVKVAGDLFGDLTTLESRFIIDNQTRTKLYAGPSGITGRFNSYAVQFKLSCLRTG